MNVPKLRFKNAEGADFPLWTMSKLGNEVQFSKGGKLGKSDLQKEGSHQCLLYGELYTSYGSIASKIFSRTDTDSDTTSQKYDVVMPTSGETAEDIATATCIPFDGILYGGDLIILRSQTLYGPFLSYQINSSLKRKISRVAQGKSVVHIGAEKIKPISFSFPCLEEQQKIAFFFSTLDQKIELNERKLETLEKLKKGVMQKIFKRAIRFKKNGEDFPKWNKVKIQEMGEIRTGTTPKNNQEGVYGGPHYWVTPTDIKSKEIYQTNKTLTDSGLQSGRVIPANSVLVTCIASIGKNAILRRKGSCNQQINAITPNQNFNVDFVYYAITHAEPILHRLAGQGGMEIINKRDFSEAELFVPCLEEQNAIAAFLSSLDRKIQISSERINNLNSLKQGFMQQMFV